jgi:carbohydrate binding protein with CBM4/9 domain/glycosyl hydrolase family 18 (putative chitinase)
MLRSRLVAVLAAGSAAAAAVLVGFAVTTSASAAATAMPTHVFAPYFESWTGDSPAALSAASGDKYLTMAFLQTASAGSCTALWNGTTPVSSSSFGSDISTIQNDGGNVVPSFGGYSADTTGTDIADSCTNVGSIAAAYESVVTTYDVTRIDLDVEADSLSNTAGINRRNQAIKQVEDWAAANGRTVQFVYTLPTTTTGLTSGYSVLQNAVSNGARVDVVNIMTFDYYDGATHEMANDTKTAASGLYNQLAGLYPGKSSSELWQMVGVTEMIGIDDYGTPETFTLADASTVESWAAGQGIAELSFWALQRDNGGCPGTKGAGNCSGVSQSTWQFSKVFQPFTSGAGSSPSPSPTSPSPSPTTSPGVGLVNGDFESGALAPWSCTGGTGKLVSSPAHSGGSALAATPTDSDDATCSQTVTLAANHTYTLTAYVQGDYAYLGTSGAASNGSNWVSAGSWTKLSTSFTTGSDGTAQIWVHGWYAQGTIYADDISVS